MGCCVGVVSFFERRRRNVTIPGKMVSWRRSFVVVSSSVSSRLSFAVVVWVGMVTFASACIDGVVVDVAHMAESMLSDVVFVFA